jgi:hypothetical protein
MNDQDQSKTEGGGAVASSDLLCSAMIMQGLLASGDYTHKVRDDGEDEPEVRTWDRGKEWKEDGADRRYASHAAGDAAWLLEELKERLKPSEDDPGVLRDFSHPHPTKKN